MLAYKPSGNPLKHSTDDSIVSLTDGLLLSIPMKPKEMQALNENEWPGPYNLIARVAFINTSNKRSHTSWWDRMDP